MFSAIKIDNGALFYGSLNFVLTVGMTPKVSTGSSNVTCSVHCSEAVQQTSEKYFKGMISLAVTMCSVHMFKNISATCRNSVLWRKSPDEYWAHSWWSHRCYIWGTPEADGCLAESQWRSHLWNKTMESTERHGHTRSVVRLLNQNIDCVKQQQCMWNFEILYDLMLQKSPA